MRNWILGAIGVVWGGFITLNLLRVGITPGDPGYVTGQYVGGGFGILMLASGLYYLIKGDGTGPRKKKKKKARKRVPAIPKGRETEL
jgi:hypothetical protein